MSRWKKPINDDSTRIPRPPHRKRYNWFRHYNGFCEHPKWRLVAKMTGVKITDVLAIASRLLECANHGSPRGAIDSFSVLETACTFDLDPNAVERVYRQLEVIGWIDSCYLSTWDERQPDKEDTTGSERTARRRRRRAELGLLRDFDAGLFYPHLAARDGEQCIYCLAEDVPLEIDHIQPICAGGTDKIDNLGFACRSCNARKAGRNLGQTDMKILIRSAFAAHERYLASNVLSVSHAVTHDQTQTQTSKKKEGLIDFKTGDKVDRWDEAEAYLKEQRKQQIQLPLPPVMLKQRFSR